MSHPFDTKIDATALAATLRSIHDGMLSFPERLRRNRIKESVRNLISETHLLPQHLIMPYFVRDGIKDREPIESMPGVFRHSIDSLLRSIEHQLSLGVRSAILFFYVEPELKDWHGSSAYTQEGLFFRAIDRVKKEFPELLLIADIALDPFTDHGFDGVIDESKNAPWHVLNDASVVALGQMAINAAAAGADIIAPSDMMDGRIGYLRHLLDRSRAAHVGILSYAVKYTSALYGPFRDALDSGPRRGDKKGFQLSPSNAREALLECRLDEQESADMLMIKPAISSLDVIAKLRQQTLKPIGAFQVSGEYSMIQAAHERGWIDGNRALIESLTVMRRAGADFIISYGACFAAELLAKQH